MQSSYIKKILDNDLKKWPKLTLSNVVYPFFGINKNLLIIFNVAQGSVCIISGYPWIQRNCLKILNLMIQDKRYFIIDQQIASHFVHYSECLYYPLPLYATQIINHFLTSRISQPITIKGLDFCQS